MSDPVKPFDLRRKRLQRTRAGRHFADHDFLHRRALEDVADRLEAVNRRFDQVLVLCDGGLWGAVMSQRPHLADKFTRVWRADTAPGWGADMVIDPECYPFAPARFDLIVSVLHLHWVNDLPGAMIQLRNALKPDGLFIAALFGGATLQELRESLLVAETAVTGGAGPRISPFADALDMAGLLQRAGFALPVSDVDRIKVRYRDLLRLFSDLRGMGETAALADPAPSLRLAVLLRALEHYRDHFTGNDGRQIASFDILTATGWAPHDSQQKALRPGAAQVRLADALGVQEQTAGEKAGR